MSRWRLQFKEAEARLAELTGDKSGDAKRLVWGVGDEERFRGELDEKVGVAGDARGSAFKAAGSATNCLLTGGDTAGVRWRVVVGDDRC